MLDWLEQHPELLYALTGASVFLLAAGVLLVPLVIIRLPADYLTRTHDHRRDHHLHPTVRVILRIARNLLGALLILVGIALLLLPGQGVLVILAGLLMTDIPGKGPLVRQIIRRPPILRTINWLRKKAGRSPLHSARNNPARSARSIATQRPA